MGCYDFYSRTSCEVRLIAGYAYYLSMAQFLLTHLLRGATSNIDSFAKSKAAISTHAPLARCDVMQNSEIISLFISTHAPLARCDYGEKQGFLFYNISTHAPLARCDYVTATGININIYFYSRTSCEVRRPNCTNLLRARKNFYSRTSCEVRRCCAPR